MPPLAFCKPPAPPGCRWPLAGDNLVVEADLDPPPELLAELREHKAELIAVLSGDDPEERAAIIAEGAGVPRAWAEGYAALCTMPPPAGFWPERWQRIIDATGAFLDRWAAEAIRCGWSDLDVFGCHPDAPDRPVRLHGPGAAAGPPRGRRRSTTDGADLVTATGARQRFRRRPLPPGTVALWQLAAMTGRGGSF